MNKLDKLKETSNKLDAVECGKYGCKVREKYLSENKPVENFGLAYKLFAAYSLLSNLLIK